MTSLIRNIAVVTLLGIGLAACGGSDNTASPPPVPVVVPPLPAPRLEDGFGVNFGTAFRADANTEARDPVAGDIIPLSLTTEPTTI